MTVLYFLFLIINISIIIAISSISGDVLFVFLFSIIFNFSFFLVNICIKKTISANISFFLYLIFCVCIIITFFQFFAFTIGTHGIPDYKTPSGIYFLLIVGAITFIISYTIVLIQIIRDFSIEIRKCPIKKSSNVTMQLRRPELQDAQWAKSTALVGEELRLRVSAKDKIPGQYTINVKKEEK